MNARLGETQYFIGRAGKPHSHTDPNSLLCYNEVAGEAMTWDQVKACHTMQGGDTVTLSNIVRTANSRATRLVESLLKHRGTHD